MTTRFVYDGEQSVLETNGSNQTTLYRTPGVGWVRNGAQRYEFESALGSSLIVRDQSGATTGRTEYEAFGNESYQDNLGDRGEYRFAGAKGYQNDDATGMQLLGARYYLPLLGRFLTQDPIGHEGGLNLYAYCANSPLMNVDPDGLEIKRLNALQRGQILSAAGRIFDNGYGDQAATIRSMVKGGHFVLETDFAGGDISADAHGTYIKLSPDLFKSLTMGGSSGASSRAAIADSRAWLEGVLIHELHHNQSQITPGDTRYTPL